MQVPQKYYLAIDIGASSGRHILGTVTDGRIEIEEIYRFDNGLIRKNGHLCWDLDTLFEEVKNGLKRCFHLNKIPVSVGIDTWGVDFVLLDKDDRILGDTVGYRDQRTEGMDALLREIIPLDKVYERTGIQKQIFNSIYQLMAIRRDTPEVLAQAETFLMIPDYLNYLLTGRKRSEYTNATTTQLVNADTKDWDDGLIRLLGLKRKMFLPLAMPKTVVGNFTRELEKEIGFTCEVILPATHDTGSAVLAVPANDDDFIYISSGTWSLMGIEIPIPNCTGLSMEHNFTNEGGYEYRYRYLKNIMGLWMIQRVRDELSGAQYSFSELCEMAEQKSGFPSRVDVNAACFLSPESMIREIKEYCRASHQQVPEIAGELAACIYHSLAESYGDTVKEIEMLTGRKFSRIHIVGGGSNAGYLNELTAKATGKEVFTGPVEATALGNLIVQMIEQEEFHSLEEARNCIYHSFAVQKVEKK